MIPPPAGKVPAPKSGLVPAPAQALAPRAAQALPGLAELRRPERLPLLLGLALQAAGMAWAPERAERLQQAVRGLLERHPRANPQRLARLAVECEKAGLPGDAAFLDGLAAWDGFAREAPGLADAGADSPGGGGGQARPDQGSGFGPDDSAPDPEALPAAGPGLSAPSGEGGWTWVRLPERDWYRSASLRLENAPGQAVALDLVTGAGRWEFYWREPERSCLWYRGPEGSRMADAGSALPGWLRGLGFQDIRMASEDAWMDGFNIFEISSILPHVDVVV